METNKNGSEGSYFKRAWAAIWDGLHKPHMGLRWLLLLCGILLLGICVANLKLVGFGNDPLSTVSFGMANLTGISMGTWHVVLMGLMFIPVLIIRPGMIGAGAILNMCCIGYIADATRWATARLMGGAALSPAARYVLFFCSIAAFLVGAAFYTAADLGFASYDAIPILISERLKKVKFRTVRMVWDLSFVLIGFCLGSEIGLTTLLLGFCLGPAIGFIVEKLNQVLDNAD